MNGYAEIMSCYALNKKGFNMNVRKAKKEKKKEKKKIADGIKIEKQN